MASTGSPLDSYRAKRDFQASPEPAGSDDATRTRNDCRFVVQRHDASNLHWDLRIEHDGVLLSWAVPRGIPLRPRRDRLAIRTEDHPIEYLEFEGEIPDGSYGAGKMSIHDSGACTLEELDLDAGKVHVRFDGDRVQGRYTLVRTDARDDVEHWLLRRLDPADPSRFGSDPVPRHVRPMLARPGALPDDPEHWAFEVKWDGVRAIASIEDGRLRLESRNGIDLTEQFPELDSLARSLGGHDAVLDGELVAFEANGRPSFQAIQPRVGARGASKVRRLVATRPVRYMAFDVLHLDGHDLRGATYVERRRVLEALLEDSRTVAVPPRYVGDGESLLEAVGEQGMEGVVAKRLDSRYLDGERSGAWRKIKHQLERSFVIGGFTTGSGRRESTFGALLLGWYDEAGTLTYVGSVGTGFDEATLVHVRELLDPIQVDESPFDTVPAGTRSGPWGAGRAARSRVRFVEPRLVCDVSYAERTRDGTLRHPSFRGMRIDLDPQDVRNGGDEP